MKVVHRAISKGKWALMLCGGLGSRMGSLTANTPKPLLLVHEKPIIWYSFWTLYQKGFRNFVLPLGYLGHMVQDCVSQFSKNLDCTIHFVNTGRDVPIASRIQQVCHLIPEHEDFFLLNTDTLFDFDIDAMHRHHLSKNAAVTLSSVEVISPWGILTVVGDDVVGFDRNRKVQKLISSHVQTGYGVVNSGLAWVKKSALSLVDFDNVGDFETDLFGAAIREGKVAHFKLDGIWVPIDTPKDLAAINYTLDTGAKDSEPIKNLLSNLEQTIILNSDRDHQNE